MPVSPIELAVEEFTSPNPVTAPEEAGVEELRQLMRQHGVRHLPIVRGQEVVGIVSDRDLKVLSALEPEHQALVSAADLMAGNPVSVGLNQRLDEVALQMSERKIGSVVVLDGDGKFYGIFTATDALNALIEVIRASD